MRTVSFSPAKIRNALNRDFVCHMINTEGDPSSGASQVHAPGYEPGRVGDGIAKQNVQLLFMTPKGEIFHTASGFQSAEKLEKELVFSKKLFADIRKSPETAEQIVRKKHQVRREQEAAGQRTMMRNPRSFQQAFDAHRAFSRLSRLKNDHDYEFSQEHPMLPIEQLQQNPRLLVGNGTSAFASGSASGGSIGRNSFSSGSGTRNRR